MKNMFLRQLPEITTVIPSPQKGMPMLREDQITAMQIDQAAQPGLLQIEGAAVRPDLLLPLAEVLNRPHLPVTEVNLFQEVQEAQNNIKKHAL